MSSKLITPPTNTAVSLAAARAAARVDGDAMDGEILQAVQGYTDDAEFETQRALVAQTRRVTLDRFERAIRLERPPLLSVVHVKFFDQAGQLQILDPQDYQVDAESEPGYIVPAPGKAWPATADRINAVQVEYTCGYGPDDAAVPAGIKSYILAKVAEQFAPSGSPAAAHVPRLLDGFRVYG